MLSRTVNVTLSVLFGNGAKAMVNNKVEIAIIVVHKIRLLIEYSPLRNVYGEIPYKVLNNLSCQYASSILRLVGRENMKIKNRP